MDDPDSLREFIRELMLRFDKRVAEFDRRAERNHRESMARFDALQEDMRELREDSRAQTQALLRVIDRLDGGGATA
jgi:hypothetical protein